MVNPREIPSWMAAEYPFTPRHFRTPEGYAMSYLDEGPRGAEAVVMLHGNPTWSYYYRHLVRALAPARRCIVPDHIGMGASAQPAGYSYTLASRISDVVALIDSLGLTQVDLVLHDWGGAIGMGFAARRFGLIRRIAVMNTAAFTSRRLPARIALCRLPGVGPLLVRGANGFAWPATWMAMHRRSLSPAEKRGYLWPYGSWAGRVAVDAFVRDIPMAPSHRSWATLREVESSLARFRDREVLAVWGLQDFCFNETFLHRWRDEFPQATVHPLHDAGHYVLDDAREEALPLIRDFLLKRA